MRKIVSKKRLISMLLVVVLFVAMLATMLTSIMLEKDEKPFFTDVKVY